MAKAQPLTDNERYDEREMDVLVRSVVTQFEQYVKLNRKVPPEILTSLAGIEQPGRLVDVNRAFTGMTGLTREELEGCSVEQFEEMLRERCDPQLAYYKVGALDERHQLGEE